MPVCNGDEGDDRLERLLEIGTALSAETDLDALLERILDGARYLTGADAGTVYRVAGDQLRFATVHNTTLGLRLGGRSGVPVTFPDLPLYLEDGSPNRKNVAAYVAVFGETVRLEDAYCAEGFDFSGTRRIDSQTGYRSRSFLTIPMRDHEDTVIGVLQLINAIDPATKETISFSERDARIAGALASQAATALTKQTLIDAQRELFAAFTRVIAKSIDRKNPVTGKHCERVPELTLMIADAACATCQGPLAEYQLNRDQYDELRLAAWLHDCGKITTPEAVVNKSTKLERQSDAIAEIATRAVVVCREYELQWLKDPLAAVAAGGQRCSTPLEEHIPGAADGAADVAFAAQLRAFHGQLEADLAFLRRANLGGEFMADDLCERVDAIATRYTWTDLNGERRPLLSAEEAELLKIRRGTLSADEMKIMRQHVEVTREMLEQLPFPKHLARVPEIAVQHHERIDGAGYPDGIPGKQMSMRARMMAIADVFEALTAADRPYKSAKKLSEAVRIMGFMTKEGHLDPQLFDLFIREGVYRRYAEQFMRSELIDTVDERDIPGYQP
ncbi:phosphohydrolase [Halorhodospira abdelmalekii]|uniref:HD domain-containing phosphohydrolase n=1 Tax=Halorhodospira abdelmalekii TaxID=421629 RepID=UPI0019042D89|nr:HD domain-containing phosphohydrolase [Halorhodospira abdelmalekii]MBK1734457.1 phosphohydrolase [Halorhodospira abdelmalekii]